MSDPSDENRTFFRNYVKAEGMVQLAIAIPAGCFIGWLLGSWLDRHFHTDWIAIAGVVLGAIGGFARLITVAAHYLKDKQ